MNILDFKDKLISSTYKSWLYNYSLTNETYPLIIEIDPTSNCMFSCPECINSNIVNQKSSFSKSQLENLINEFSEIGVKGIIFIGGGEPLMHPQIGEILHSCFKKNIKIGITTNGLLINKYITEISEYASWTRVSIDASNAKTFSKVRPTKYKNAFNNIITNMYNLSKVKKGLVGFSFLLIEQKNFSNLFDIYDAAKLAKEIGCDYFEFKPMVDKDHNLFSYSKFFLENLLNEIEKIKELETNDFKIINPKSINKYFESNLNQKKEYDECPIAHLRTLITPHGVFPCPYKRGYEEFNIGKINNSFKEIWKTSKKNDVLKKLDPSVYCNFYCIRNDLNLFLASIKKNPEILDTFTFDKNDDVFI